MEVQGISKQDQAELKQMLNGITSRVEVARNFGFITESDVSCVFGNMVSQATINLSYVRG